MSKDSLKSKSVLKVNSTDYEIFDITRVAGANNLPFSLKILLENLFAP